MVRTADVIAAFLGSGRGDDSIRPHRAQRLNSGVYHVDYNDPDHVFRVSVQQVPRRWLPLDRRCVVGRVTGIQVVLVNVAIANHVELLLDAEDGPGKVAAIDEYKAEQERWQAAAEPEEPPPAWPASRLMTMSVSVADDVGTDYERSTARAGGSGSEWEVQRTFLPPPPAGARRLYLDFASPGAESVRVELPLPAGHGDLPVQE